LTATPGVSSWPARIRDRRRSSPSPAAASSAPPRAPPSIHCLSSPASPPPLAASQPNAYGTPLLPRHFARPRRSPMRDGTPPCGLLCETDRVLLPRCESHALSASQPSESVPDTIAAPSCFRSFALF